MIRHVRKFLQGFVIFKCKFNHRARKQWYLCDKYFYVIKYVDDGKLKPGTDKIMNSENLLKLFTIGNHSVNQIILNSINCTPVAVAASLFEIFYGVYKHCSTEIPKSREFQ